MQREVSYIIRCLKLVTMVSYWFFRMGSGGKYVELSREGSFIAFGWNEVGDLSWAKEKDFENAKEKLTKIFKEKYPDNESALSISQSVGQLIRFVQIQEGNIVLVPDPPKKIILVGKIKGDYFFDESATGFCDYKHKRTIEWITEVSRENLSQKLKYSLGSLLSLGNLSEYAEEIENLIETGADEGNITVEENGEYEIPLSERKIITEPRDPTIKDLCERIDKGKININAEFQRKYVWEDRPKLKSKLIESALLKLPIPVIYTAEEPNGNEMVIDGQQRLRTFYDFRNQQRKFSLSGLTVLKELNGYTYDALGNETDPIIKKITNVFGNLQDRIDNYPLRVIKILKESQKDIKFDIFERLNRGSVQLNEQELRNCIYRGNFNDLIKKLTKNPDFLRLQNLDEPDKRMGDTQRILRFFAFCDESERKYKSPLKKFLNDYMTEKRNLKEPEIAEKERILKKSVEICQTVFGEHAFRRAYQGNEEDPNGSFDKKINEGIFDIQMYGFMEYEKRDIIDKTQVIKDAFLDIVTGNEAFIETIEKGTYDTTKVKKRTEIWFSKLREIIGYPKNDRRLYTYAEKEQLFKSNPTCEICKNKIAYIEDAHVDHIQRYSETGQTTKINGQLTHRYCNLKKG